jgi:hypothetical protein
LEVNCIVTTDAAKLGESADLLTLSAAAASHQLTSSLSYPAAMRNASHIDGRRINSAGSSPWP